jgi:ketosteroid isomerase-like protein
MEEVGNMTARMESFLPAESAYQVSPMSAEEAEIRRIEIEWGNAFLQRDITTLDRIIDDEYILTDPLGQVRDKTESIAAIKSSDVQFESTESDNIKVAINGDTAVVTARSTFRGCYKGWNMTGYQYTDVFVKRSGAWRAVVSHITPLGILALRLRLGRFFTDWLFG